MVPRAARDSRSLSHFPCCEGSGRWRVSCALPSPRLLRHSHCSADLFVGAGGSLKTGGTAPKDEVWRRLDMANAIACQPARLAWSSDRVTTVECRRKDPTRHSLGVPPPPFPRWWRALGRPCSVSCWTRRCPRCWPSASQRNSWLTAWSGCHSTRREWRKT